MTYKSLNQRITGQNNYNAHVKSSKFEQSTLKNPVLKTKVISQRNFRTKQNSPTKRVPSEEQERVS